MAEIPWRHPVDESFLTGEKTKTNVWLGVFYDAASMLREEAIDRLPNDLEFLKALAHVTAYLAHFSGRLTANPWTPRSPEEFETFMLTEGPQEELPQRILAT